jgi:glucose-6-phosphate isomerase
MIRDVILIGRGTPVAALQFVYSALLKDERAMLATRFGLVEAAATRIRRTLVGGTSQMRTMRFLTTIDPISAASAVADLDPASTLVISIALNGNEETGLATKTIKSWLLNALGSTRRADHILSKHMLLVTGNDRIVSVINKPERVHIVPEHSRCEAFTTFSPAGLLVRRLN